MVGSLVGWRTSGLLQWISSFKTKMFHKETSAEGILFTTMAPNITHVTNAIRIITMEDLKQNIFVKSQIKAYTRLV